MPAPVHAPLRLKNTATVWDYLALSDEELERADVVALNTAVARGIAKHKDLDVNRYCTLVDAWTAEFARRLPASEEFFWQKGPQIWKNDIRFYRMGMLQSFLTHTIGVKYIEEQKGVGSVYYTNAADIFLFGLIDTLRGTCGNLSALHVAMARRMGWPVSLACLKSHYLSRFDDGEVVYNIECSFNEEYSDFSFGTDSEYMAKHKLPKKAVECGSDLRKVTVREMIGVFLALRARHYRDMGKHSLCDMDCALSRSLFPNYRMSFVLGMVPYFKRGEQIFNPDEVGHPRSIGGSVEAEVAECCPDESVKLNFNIQYIYSKAPKPAPVKPEKKMISIPIAGTF